MKTSHRRAIKWALVNGTIATLAWFAVIEQVEGAGRVLTFISWAFAILFLLAAGNSQVSAEARRIGRSVPAWLSHGYGLTVLCALVWHGWIGTAIAWALIEISEVVVYADPERIKKAAKLHRP
jgi:hypothetical protein